MLETINGFFSSSIFWVSSLVMGLIIHIVGGWINVGLAKSTNRLLSKWRERSLKQKEVRLNRVEAMRGNTNLLQFFIMKVNNYHAMAVMYMTLAIIFAVVMMFKHFVKHQGIVVEGSGINVLLPLIAIITSLAFTNLIFASDLQEDVRRSLIKKVNTQETPSL
ncbi:MAG: hypothetical protein ACMG51_04715 [Ginsengibacter sp.]